MFLYCLLSVLLNFIFNLLTKVGFNIIVDESYTYIFSTVSIHNRPYIISNFSNARYSAESNDLKSSHIITREVTYNNDRLQPFECNKKRSIEGSQSTKVRIQNKYWFGFHQLEKNWIYRISQITELSISRWWLQKPSYSCHDIQSYAKKLQRTCSTT